jgi:hypothetical protein
MENDYGPFKGLVEMAGFLVSTVIALRYVIKGKVKWDPSEEDVPKGGQRVAGAISVLFLIYLLFTDAQSQFDIVKTLQLLIPVLVVSLLGYGFVINQFTFDSYDGAKPIKVIGGFTLTKFAGKTIEEKGITIQEYFEGVQYKKDRVWPRWSSGLAKALFQIFYIVLIISLTTAIAFSSIIGQKYL